MAIQNVRPVDLKALNAELERLIKELKDNNLGWDQDEELKRAIKRLEGLFAVSKNECAQSETYPAP